jgi:MarR family transcriptional regulator, transcriptional regulator for hemolysin
MTKATPFKHENADDSPGFLLWKITAVWQGKLAEALTACGLTQTQYAILASLRWFEEKGEPITQTHLVEHTKIDKMTLSKAIRKLEDGGLVSRDQSTSDSRATNVEFTARGRKVIQQAIVGVETLDEEFFSCLTKTQLQQYQSIVLTVIESNDQK